MYSCQSASLYLFCLYIPPPPVSSQPLPAPATTKVSARRTEDDSCPSRSQLSNVQAAPAAPAAAAAAAAAEVEVAAAAAAAAEVEVPACRPRSGHFLCYRPDRPGRCGPCLVPRHQQDCTSQQRCSVLGPAAIAQRGSGGGGGGGGG